MKKQGIKVFVVLGLLLSVSAIYVNALGKTLIRKVEIPFDFSVGNKTFPAGVYNVTSLHQEKIMLRLSSEDGREVIHFLSHPIKAKETPSISKLIFHRYGGTYFLAQIWESFDDQGRQLAKSSAEKSVERDLLKKGERIAIVPIVSKP